jgi:hypothetical protein
MSDIGNNNKSQIDCLIADFEAIKSEISRRSNLQRVVLAAFVTVSAYITQKVLDESISYIWILVIWTSSFLSITFYFREDLEIHRLGTIIRYKITKSISEYFTVSNLELFPSENEYDKRYLKYTKPYDVEFNWIVFFVFPFAVSIYILINNQSIYCNICNFRTITPWVLMLSAMALVRTLWLLVRHSFKDGCFFKLTDFVFIFMSNAAKPER